MEDKKVTIQSLIADLRAKHGDELAAAAIARLLNLTAIAVNGDWTPEQHQETNLLREWLSDVVAAGADKMTQDLFGGMICTICHCPVSECIHPGQHMDWYMTPEQLARDDAVSAEEDRWEDERCRN